MTRRINTEIIGQGVDEAVPYAVVTTPISSAPTGVTFNAVDVESEQEISGTLFPEGAPATVDGDTITLPVLSGLQEGQTARVAVAWSSGPARYSVYFYVRGER